MITKLKSVDIEKLGIGKELGLGEQMDLLERGKQKRFKDWSREW